MGKGKWGQIKHFTDIEAWKIGREIRNSIYAFIKTLPNEEKYNLNSQMRRAAVSITANIVHPVRYLSCEMRSIIFHGTEVYLTGQGLWEISLFTLWNNNYVSSIKKISELYFIKILEIKV